MLIDKSSLPTVITVTIMHFSFVHRRGDRINRTATKFAVKRFIRIKYLKPNTAIIIKGHTHTHTYISNQQPYLALKTLHTVKHQSVKLTVVSEAVTTQSTEVSLDSVPAVWTNDTLLDARQDVKRPPPVPMSGSTLVTGVKTNVLPAEKPQTAVDRMTGIEPTFEAPQTEPGVGMWADQAGLLDAEDFGARWRCFGFATAPCGIAMRETAGRVVHRVTIVALDTLEWTLPAVSWLRDADGRIVLRWECPAWQSVQSKHWLSEYHNQTVWISE